MIAYYVPGGSVLGTLWMFMVEGRWLAGCREEGAEKEICQEAVTDEQSGPWAASEVDSC